MPIPDLALIIARDGAGATTAALQLTLPNRTADLAEAVPLALDAEALRAVAHLPAVYGATLTALGFAPPLLLDSAQSAQSASAADRADSRAWAGKIAR